MVDVSGFTCLSYVREVQSTEKGAGGLGEVKLLSTWMLFAALSPPLPPLLLPGQVLSDKFWTMLQ
jgi:hypothetical protein